MFAQSTLPDHTHTQHESRQLQNLKETPSKSIELQYPIALKVSTNAYLKLRLTSDHCYLFQIKFGEVFHFSLHHIILPTLGFSISRNQQCIEEFNKNTVIPRTEALLPQTKLDSKKVKAKNIT